MKLPVFKITFENGDTVTTSMSQNTTLADAREYYLGKYFSPGVGPEDRPAVKATHVEQLEPEPVLHGKEYFAAITEEQHQQIGEEIARVLHLKQARDDMGRRYKPARYETTHGSKTAIGLSRTMASLFEQGTRNFVCPASHKV